MAVGDPSTSKGRAVGALACQSDSYLTTLDTEVVSCVQAPRSTQSNSKAKQGGNAEVGKWLVEFADSVLFPEGGGQPCDHGTLEKLNGSDETLIQVQNVQRQGLRCIVDSPQPLTVGDKVRQQVDWKRRWDHMQQHTGQHLLSAVMKKLYPDLQTLGWGMGGEGSMNYVDVPRKPTQDELNSIQESCTRMIRDNHKIWMETPDDAKNDSLPEDYDKAEGVVRVIRIGDFDTNTCCGTHLSQTSHVGLILFGSVQSVHGKNFRLQFMAGDRAISFATASANTVNSLAKLTSSKLSASEVLDKINDMSGALTESRRNEKKLLLEIANYESDIARHVIKSGKNVLVHRADGGMDFVNRVIGELKDVVLGTGFVVVVAVGEVKDSGPVFITGDKDAVSSMSDKVKSVVTNIKGGGNGNRWQGKVPEWQKTELKEFKALFDS